ncbi:Axonemal dynein light chain domain-containing protein 1 [Triplophysa tibetana]|uniref:Axonemal dynein light chain domain-containing protein 1 n=1 Tax=Triplophysa tibetana TaxID=1572043 RepID=A0A5A9NRR2_9TELE|nr:Axonemal dynein light chain domain-containing protein 1 [Triplophysa tibetana]
MKDKSSLQEEGIHSDLIPDELLATLTSTICPQNTLGPLKLSKTPKDFKVCLQHRPDALWHQPAGRKKYKYFLDQPTSISGHGRDISFLCDAFVYQKDRLHVPHFVLCYWLKDMSPLETLIPEEYHIIKSKGLRGLQCYDDKFTVLLEDNEQKLRVFPSMKPTSRLEVMQLMRVMDDMLEKAGVNQDLQELSELSQMENLLELVRAEQNIYNIVFHELIRQVSVECAERGQLLAKLRQRYAALLDRIPWQVKGLHSETLAQRALDRRLTEEIMSFRNSVTKLNMELSMMKEHDECVSKEAEESKEELAKALEESQRNADIVAKYHDLYELQRRRLRGQMLHLSDERDLWRKATYSLAIKIIKINKLQLVKRLNVSEQTWAKTAEHFTLVLTTKDSEDVSHMIELTDQWKENLTTFMENLRKTEGTQRETIQSVRAHIVKWQKICEDQIRSPDMKTVRSSEEELSYDLKQWSTVLTQQCERYGGEELVSSQETLEMLTNLQESWIEVCLRLFRRHPASDGGPPKGQEAMGELSKTITELHKQLRIRINGESGIHAMLMSLSDNMEFWSRRLKSQIHNLKGTGIDIQDVLKTLKDFLSCQAIVEEEILKTLTHHDTENELHQLAKLQVKPALIPFDQSNFPPCEAFSALETVRSLQQELFSHIHNILVFKVLVLNMNRDQFGPKGPLELNSERLIKEASVDERKANCHDDIIHFLLDSGSLHETLAEKTPQNLCAELQSLKISEEPEADHPPGREQDTPTLEPNARMKCQMGAVTPADSQETVSKTPHLKTEEQKQWVTMKLLLDRGADPNASTIPMPVIFLAVKAAHVEGVRRLVLCGARTDIPLTPEQKGLYPLHIAAGLPGAEGPQITELLLHALADPDVKAQDADEVYELDEALDELLAAGADPNLPLARRVGSALCTLANISYDRGPEARNQINLVFLFS